MTGYVIRRVLWMIPVLWAITTLTFFLMHATPGGPFDSEKPVPPAALEAVNARYNLDKSVPEQYVLYMWDLLNIDMGISFQGDREVTEVLATGLPVSFQLGAFAFAYSMVLGMTLGVVGALKRNRTGDYLSAVFSTMGTAMPNFVIASFMVVIFSVKLGWFDVLGWGGPPVWPWDVEFWVPGNWDYRKMVLPILALGTLPAAFIARIARASVLEVLGQDYIRTARAKGIPERGVILRHALRNALVPILTVSGPILAGLVTGSFIVEQIFAINGVGRHFVTAIARRDYALIMGVTIFYALVVAVANLVVDILYGIVDPRITYR
jgi:oligopeptide transport system permease protein